MPELAKQNKVMLKEVTRTITPRRGHTIPTWSPTQAQKGRNFINEYSGHIGSYIHTDK